MNHMRGYYLQGRILQDQQGKSAVGIEILQFPFPRDSCGILIQHQGIPWDVAGFTKQDFLNIKFNCNNFQHYNNVTLYSARDKTTCIVFIISLDKCMILKNKCIQSFCIECSSYRSTYLQLAIKEAFLNFWTLNLCNRYNRPI